MVAVAQSFHFLRGGAEQWEEEDPCWESADLDSGPAINELCDLWAVSLPGSLFLRQGNKGLGKINTGLDQMIRRSLCVLMPCDSEW